MLLKEAFPSFDFNIAHRTSSGTCFTERSSLGRCEFCLLHLDVLSMDTDSFYVCSPVNVLLLLRPAPKSPASLCPPTQIPIWFVSGLFFC